MAYEDSEFVIVGGGLLGLAAGAALARRGRQVALLEQATVGHPGAGSKGSCRIFRLGYPDPEYVALARQAREFWTELEHSAGTQLLIPTPQLTFGRELGAVHEAMLAAGAPGELLPAGEAARRFPGVAVPGPVLYEPGSCVIDAAAALRSLATAVPALREQVTVTGLADDGRRVTVTTRDGQLTCRAVIVCAGPWTAGLLAPAGITLPSAATQEQAAYFTPARASADAPAGAPAGGAAGRTGLELPILLEYSAQSFYALPVPGAPLCKAGLHHGGLPADPGHQEQGRDAGLASCLAEPVRRYLPALTPRAVRYERCVYDNTPDEDFVVGRIGNVVIGSGTSGHGFKFGPLLGEWLAALATGETARPPVPRRFAPGRFSRRADRGGGRGGARR